MGKLSLTVLGCFGVIALIPFTVFSGGVLTYYLWKWFVMTTFTMVPAITITQAIGLNFFINLFKNHDLSNINRDGEKKEFNFTPVVFPWIALFLAWVFKSIFM